MSALQSARPQREYSCGQEDLYTVVETGWGSYAQHLPRFEGHSSLYTAATGTGQIAALALARALPDEDSREEVHKTLRVQLKHLADDCLIKWSDMESFIRDGFAEDEYDNKIIAAGHNHYREAGRDDWDAVKALMQNGQTFLTANAAILSSGGMLATFPPAFGLAKTSFETKYQAFIQAEEDTKVMTDQKIVANNGLYRALMKMFNDGKKLFRDAAAIREQFTFERVLALVNGGSSGTGVPATVIEIGVYVFDEETNAPVKGAVFRVLNAPDGVTVSATSNAEGIAHLTIHGYAANETVMVEGEVTADGYLPDSGEMPMTAGNFYSIEVPMTPEIL
jgi:hypothetical protein